MSKAGSRKRRFNKTLFCLYQSTSDDLMFWCWFDVLILSMNYGFSMTQISLLFSVSFWAALAMKLPANALAKKLGAARCVLLSAALFLSAALLLTFGSTFAVAVVGQSIYLAAGSFQEMATVIAKKAAERDPAHVDYMQLMSTTGVIFSVISLIGAVSMSRLYEINKNLPMYICIGFCLNSCVLAYFISKYDEEDTKESQRTRRETLPDAYSVEEMARDTAEAMKALGLKDVYLFGASQGGMMALVIAIEYPELVQKLVLGSTSAHVLPEQFRSIERWIALAEANDPVGLYLSFGEKIYPPAVFGQFRDVLIAAGKTVTAEELRRFIILAKGIEGFDVSNRVAEIRCPVLAIGVFEDEVLDADATMEIAEKLDLKPDFRLYLYAGYGHAAFDTAPDYRERIKRFFAEG